MRSFRSLALRKVRARRLRSLLTAAGIVLGVAMILGVLLLTVTIHRTFTDLFDSVYGRTDLVVSGDGGDSVPHSTLAKVRRTPHVDDASGQVFTIFSLVHRTPPPPGAPPGTPPQLVASGDQSEHVNVSGESPNAADLSDSRTVAGRRARYGMT